MVPGKGKELRLTELLDNEIVTNPAKRRSMVRGGLREICEGEGTYSF